MTTWRKLIQEHIGWSGEPIRACTLTDAELDVEFDAESFGRVCGKAFTAWTDSWVIFPSVYDGWEGVASAPRNPCDTATGHVGGGTP